MRHEPVLGPDGPMNRSFRTGLFIGACLLVSMLWGAGQSLAAEAARQDDEALGKGVYRIGAILVDEPARRFSVTGRIVRREAPLESIAVSKGGARSGKGLIEIDSNAIEFNLACLLIGLDPRHADRAGDRRAGSPAQGDAVSIVVSWIDAGGRHKTLPAADLIDRKRQRSSQGPWVYTGSILRPDGLYMADADGTVIGFVHDPSSIIEHRLGLGGDGKDAIGADPDHTPPVGTRIELVIENPAAGTGRPVWPHERPAHGSSKPAQPAFHHPPHAR